MGLTAWNGVSAGAAEVTGRVEMPETCSPGVSPAVVFLTPAGKPGSKPSPAQSPAPADLALVRQKGLLFVPRVQAVELGQSIEFTNEDAETHSVHNVGAGTNFSLSMAPGQRIKIEPSAAGVVRLVCDIHSHMRGYVVVSPTPWFAVCGRNGRFVLADVPPGRYELNVWHEMGEPLRREFAVAADAGPALDLGVLTVTGPSIALAGGPGSLSAPRAWPEVVDRIGLALQASLDLATRPSGAPRARKLAEDSYWLEFEASDMETAVRRHLGYARAAQFESRFHDVIRAVQKVSAGKMTPAQAADHFRVLLVDLTGASDELGRMGIPDAAHIERTLPAAASATAPSAAHGDIPALLEALKKSFAPVQALADRGERDAAASQMTEAYFTAFEPLERAMEAVDALAKPRLEARYSALRGEIGAGLRGERLANALGSLQAEVAKVLDRPAAVGVGALGTAFGVSLITIVREGLEVILLLGMLVQLVTKAGQTRFLPAIRWGVGFAALASLLTAAALNALLASAARSRSRELLEGLVMLSASGLLFYVSYWLISKSEAKRWSEFLKRQVRRGAAAGSAWTLGLTAFLAVYREGAETALMYQAMFDNQPSRLGVLGILAGLGAGIVLLVGLYVLMKKASVRLPLGAFFKLSGVVLFGMAVVFAGKAVSELQTTHVIRQTALPWLGKGLPALGVYPNVQAVSVQAILLAGAALAFVFLLLEREPIAQAVETKQVGAGV